MRQSLIAQDVAAVESINFQPNTFFKELVNQVVELKKVAKAEIADSEIVGFLSKIVAHHTGLNVTFEIGDIDPCVDIPMVNKNNVLINSFIRNHLNSADGIKMINEANGVVRGSVNLKTGMVTGIFTEVKSKIHMPIVMFTTSKYDPEEVVAIMLHEIGHLFTYYEFMSRVVTTNQVLAGIAKGLDGSGTVEEREAVLINAKKAMNLSDLDTKALAKSNNNKVVEIVIISNITKQVTSEVGSNIYDFSTWEYLADQYVARQGAGRQLVTGLEKIFKGSWNISFRSLPTFLAMEAFKIVLIALGLFGVSFLLMAIDSDNATYDLPGARFKRIRDQIVENLKLKTLTKDDNERLQADLVAIDSILKDVNDRRQFFGVIWDVLYSPARKGRKQEQLQQELEAIAVNELFAKAAELKLV